MKTVANHSTKPVRAILFCLVFILLFSGCASAVSAPQDPAGIPFEYFYRGFTPVFSDAENSDLLSALGISVIESLDDWTDFTVKFCNTAGAYMPPDFSKQSLIAFSRLYGSRGNENSSFSIASITIQDGAVQCTSDEGSPESTIYAINSNGVGHWFVNIVCVDKSDIPATISGIYRASN